jgi:hypothetical protein
MMKLSALPNPASAPVSGWMNPITMSWVLAPVVDEAEDEDEVEAPLMLELQASSSPPLPTTAAPAPAARNRERRLMPPPGSANPGDRSPETSREGVLSVCAVWSLMCIDLL